MSSQNVLTALTFITIASMALFGRHGKAIECQDVVKYLVPCISYLRSTGGTVPGPCCDGVRGLDTAAASTPDRRTACSCIKAYASKISGLNAQLMGSMAGSCGVQLPFVPTPSPATDCSSVS